LETIPPAFVPSSDAFVELLKKHNTSPPTGASAAASSSSSLPLIKAIVLVSPNNPTGSIYTKELIWKFTSICSDWKVALIIDET
jgi:aspartate/methionine/tyrosine aminotransferase